MREDLITERQQKVFDFISNVNITRIQEISDALKYSPSTIRRDLKVLEEKHKIQSFHGGVSVIPVYDSFSGRSGKNAELKKKIAKKACEYVKDRDFLYIGGGSTTYQFADMLSKRHDLEGVTVVCSAMNIAHLLLSHSNFKVLVPGGELIHEDESMTSKMTIDALSRFIFTKAFIGSQAIDSKMGYTLPNLDLCELKMHLLSCTKETILLCDHTKIGKTSPYKVCETEKIQTLITDKTPKDSDELKKIADCGVKIILA